MPLVIVTLVVLDVEQREIVQERECTMETACMHKQIRTRLYPNNRNPALHTGY